MALPYTDTDDDCVATYRRIHANSEQTHVAILSAGDGRYVAVAYDIDPVDLVPIASECIAYDPTLEGVCERAKRWMERHPKGIASESDGGGIGGKLNRFFIRMFKKMDQYGNGQVEQIQDQQGGK